MNSKHPNGCLCKNCAKPFDGMSGTGNSRTHSCWCMCDLCLNPPIRQNDKKEKDINPFDKLW